MKLLVVLCQCTFWVTVHVTELQIHEKKKKQAYLHCFTLQPTQISNFLKTLVTLKVMMILWLFLILSFPVISSVLGRLIDWKLSHQVHSVSVSFTFCFCICSGKLPSVRSLNESMGFVEMLQKYSLYRDIPVAVIFIYMLAQCTTRVANIPQQSGERENIV